MAFWDKFKKKQQEPAVEKRNPMNLREGDIVTYDLEDYIVIGFLEYDDHGWKWKDYHLESGSKRIWLSVEQDDELIMGVFERIKSPVEEKPPKQLEHNGIRFEREEAGEAIISAVSGQVGAAVGHKVRYFDYCDAEEEHFFSIEEWDGDWEASYGFDVDPYELQFMAGS